MEGSREFTFITPSGVNRIWLKEDNDLANFCHYNGYSLVKEEEKEIWCFPSALAYSTREEERAFRRYEERGFQIKIFDRKK